MDFWTPQHFRDVTAGRWLVQPCDDVAIQKLSSLTIDSREIQPGCVFVAIRGERLDGHDFVPSAIRDGAGLIIVDNDEIVGSLITDLDGSSRGDADQPDRVRFDERVAVLLVDDSVRALQQLAGAWREQLAESDTTVIAVTGSNGKTTTRHMIHSVLSQNFTGTQSPKSFNNHIGVPLTLLAASCEDDFVVAEVGSNHSGEIAMLGSIIQPDVAVITTIGLSHVGHFGSEDAITVEKASLLNCVRRTSKGAAIVSEQAWRKIESCQDVSLDWRNETDAASKIELIQYATEDELSRAESRGVKGVEIALSNEHVVTLPMLGLHNVSNALAAGAVARCGAFQMGESDIAKALCCVAGVPMRMELLAVGQGSAARVGVGAGVGNETDAEAGSSDISDGVIVVNDAYNASPDSMQAAIETLARLPRTQEGRRVAVLGDMLELGDMSVAAHRNLGEQLADNKDEIDLVILVGRQMQHAYSVLNGTGAKVEYVAYFGHEDKDQPIHIASLLERGDIVLLKASRGLALEKLLPHIKMRFEADKDRATA